MSDKKLTQELIYKLRKDGFGDLLVFIETMTDLHQYNCESFADYRVSAKQDINFKEILD